MATVIRTWKCALCAKGFRAKADSAASLSRACPTCGAAMALVKQEQPAPAPLPVPQPRPVAGRPPARGDSKRRPADPAAAMATLTSSSAWTPPPDPGPSANLTARTGRSANRMSPLDELASFASGAADAVTLPAASAKTRPAPSALRSPTVLIAVGGVLLAGVALAVVLATRTTPPAAQVAATSGPATARVIAVAVAPPASAPAPRVTDLMALIDPVRDAQGGHWAIDHGQLRSDGSTRARLAIAHVPPREYDFTVDFTRTGGDNCVAQTFTVGGRSAALVLGGWKGTYSGFQHINGKWANQNPTGYRGLDWHPNVRHTSVVKVRKDRIEAWVDGRRIAIYETDGSDLSNKDWAVAPAPLGVGSEVSPTTFHRIELTENPRD